MQYEMIEESTAIALTRRVQAALDAGWQLYGNPGRQASNGHYFQAVTRTLVDVQETVKK